MSDTETTIQGISEEALTFAPSIAQVVVAVQQAAGSLPGATKLQIALAAIQAGTSAATAIPNGTVSGIAALANIFVSIFKVTIWKK